MKTEKLIGLLIIHFATWFDIVEYHYQALLKNFNFLNNFF